MLPKGFVFLSDIDSSIIENPRYFSNENFLARPVPGYAVNRIVCTSMAASALKKVHEVLKLQGYHLVVYDGYRPKMATEAFREWGVNENESAKARYYPTLTKAQLFEKGYLAGEHSTHTRGSTFDLTIIRSNKALKPIVETKRMLANGEAILFLDDNTEDMGVSFDLFHEAAHHDTQLVSVVANEHRTILRNAMKQHGFNEYHMEWWHYTLADEPFPDTYFDFPIA